jgi:hypothetical protein
MDELLSLVAGLAIPVIAILIKKVLERTLEKRTRDIVAINPQGKEEHISINANSTELEVVNAVKNAMEFERDVFVALREIENRTASLETRTGKNIDFILTYPGHKIAIEVKDSLDRLSRQQVEKYLIADQGLEKVLFVSRKPASPKVFSLVNDLLVAGKVSILSIADAHSGIAELESAIKRDLKVGDARIDS